jgi:hypothetical protein
MLISNSFAGETSWLLLLLEMALSVLSGFYLNAVPNAGLLIRGRGKK